MVQVTLTVPEGHEAVVRPVQTKRTHVIFILDASGSMEPLRDSTIGFFNETLNVVKGEAEKGGETTGSLTLLGAPGFESIVHPYTNNSIASVKKLTKETYRPYGGTPLYDAVGRTLVRAKAFPGYKEDQTSFLVYIMTDGEENSSREFSASTIRRMVTELTETGRWTFTYMGANQDLTKAVDLGVPRGSTVSYAPSASGLAGAGFAMRGSTQSYFGGRAQGMSATMDFHEDLADIAVVGASGFVDLSATGAKLVEEATDDMNAAFAVTPTASETDATP